jgi:hypothetical protein
MHVYSCPRVRDHGRFSSTRVLRVVSCFILANSYLPCYVSLPSRSSKNCYRHVIKFHHDQKLNLEPRHRVEKLQIGSSVSFHFITPPVQALVLSSVNSQSDKPFTASYDVTRLRPAHDEEAGVTDVVLERAAAAREANVLQQRVTVAHRFRSRTISCALPPPLVRLSQPH